MGVPTNVVTEQNATKTQFEVNALPIRAYVKIWNEFFRDQNVDNPATIKTDDGTQIYADAETEDQDGVLQNAIYGARCLPVSRFHDYFSSCLPYPQRGPEVTIPMDGNAFVVGYNTYDDAKPEYTQQKAKSLNSTMQTDFTTVTQMKEAESPTQLSQAT